MENKEIYKIKSIRDYLDAISYFEKKEFFSLTGSFYRGNKDYEFSLIPKILRNEYKYDRILEMNILTSFKKRALSYIKNPPAMNDNEKWLVLAQHYGVPTKLLDFSCSPLIALYFASEFNQNLDEIKDGVVWILIPLKFQGWINKKFHPIEDELIYRNLNVKASGDIDVIPYKHPIVYSPYLLDERMRAQESVFLMWGSENKPLEDMVEKVIEYTVSDQSNIDNNNTTFNFNHFLIKLIIDKDYKNQIRKQLSLLGIDKLKLFPTLDSLGEKISDENKIRYVNLDEAGM